MLVQRFINLLSMKILQYTGPPTTATNDNNKLQIYKFN